MYKEFSRSSGSGIECYFRVVKTIALISLTLRKVKAHLSKHTCLSFMQSMDYASMRFAVTHISGNISLSSGRFIGDI